MRINRQKIGMGIILALTGLFTIFGGNLFFAQQHIKRVGAIGNDNTQLTVQKIMREVDLNDKNLTDGYTYKNSLFTGTVPNYTLFTPSYKVVNGEFVLLNNYTADQILLSTSTDPLNVENILVSFGNEGSSLYWLTVTAKLNGTVINTANTISERILNGETIKTFNQALDLKTLTDINGHPFTSLQGYYEYSFSYRFLDSLGQVSESLTKNISFYLLDEQNYINVLDQQNEVLNVVPKLFNTEKIARESYYEQVEQNYFNFNNFNNTDIYNKNASSNLLFPTFIYDASRYNLSYTKLLYGVSSTVTSSFSSLNNVGEIRFYLNGSATPFKVDTVTKTEISGKSYYFYDGLQLSDIGSYTFTLKYLYKLTDATYIPATTAKIYEYSTRDNNVNLSIFGYQLYYSKNNIGDAEFKYLGENETIVTDYTKDNKTFIDDYDTVNFGYQVGEGSSLVINGTVASTNQAPVFLKYYSSLKYNSTLTVSHSYYYYYKNGSKTGTPDVIPYTNNTRFTQNGYYELVIIYDFQDYQYKETFTDLNENGEYDIGEPFVDYNKNGIYNPSSASLGNQITHMQVFAFKIANLPPIINIKTNTNEIITSGKFTNAASVSATWQASGVFDVAPTAKLWRQNFDGFNPYTQSEFFNGSYDNVAGTAYNQADPISSNGHYTLQIFYGPSTSTSIIYKFTIDKSQISGFNVTGVSSGSDNNGNVIYLKDTASNLTGKEIINIPFTLNWNQKASGASIQAKYSFTAISKQTTHTPTLIENASEKWITNGFETKNTFENLNYYRTTTLNTDVLNSNSVLKDASIYFFKLADQAGNEFTYYVVLDNSTTSIIQEPAPVSKYNFVPTTTTITWGTHKAIEVSASSNLPTAVTSNANLFKTFGGKLYLLVPIETVKVYAAGLSESSNLTIDDSYKLFTEVNGNLDIEASRIRTYQRNGGLITPSATFYTGLESSIPTGNNDVKGEKIYHTYVMDASNLTRRTNLTYNNIARLALQMNLDRSQGYAETYGAVKGNPSNTNLLLELNRASNRQFLYFNYKNSNDNYQVESLTYDFYPLTFEVNSPNYPFASTKSITMDLLQNATNLGGELYRTQAINTIFSTQYAKELTMPGKYVITRTYVAPESAFSDTGDSKVKQYVYYIDRYNIIEQLDTLLIGENIKLLLGQTSGRQPIVFDDFLINTTKQTLIETNLLPVAIIVPMNKYSIYNENTNVYSGGIGSFDLQVRITRHYLGSSGANLSESIPVYSPINGLIVLPELYKNGIYEVTIKDKTGYDVALIGSNEFTFQFEIKNNKPTGNFYGTPYANQDIALMNVTSTSEKNLSFIFTDPADIYTAKIDVNNIQVSQKLKDATSSTVIYKVVNGETTINPYNMTLVSTPIGTLIGSNGQLARNKHALSLFSEGSNLSLVEATYSVTIQYEGIESHYVYEGNNFYQNTINMTIDRTAPEFNLNRLIAADTYLTQAQKSTVKNVASEINTENYAFAITPSFTFNRATIANPTHDTNLIYYRKYTKYQSGDVNLQSILPSNPVYNDYTIQPTRPRFNIANTSYKAFNYGSGTFSSILGSYQNGDYFEIIEIDEAGNYTNYTVQLISMGANLEGGMALTPEQKDAGASAYVNFIRNQLNKNVIDALDLNVNRINSVDLWYNLQIINKFSNTVVKLNHTPLTNETVFIDSINQLIKFNPILGGSFEFTLIDRTNRGFTFTYNAQGDALVPTFIDKENSFIITLPQENASTTIQVFRVYRSLNGQYAQTPEYQVVYDMNGLSIDHTGVSLASYEFEAGEYYFYFKDNFAREYTIPKTFGMIDIAEVYFEGTTEIVNNIRYTANDVKIVYQKELYTVKVYKRSNASETFVEFVSPYVSTNPSTGVTQVWLKDIALLKNLSDEYKIVIKNSAGTETIHNFTVYTKIPTIKITDSMDNTLSSGISFSTTKSVYISYTNTPIVPFTATLILERGQETITYNNIDPEFGYYLTGNYTLRFQNYLGVVAEYTWSIQETATAIFSVIAKANGFEYILSPASEKFDYNGNLIDQYFSIYPTDPYVNPDRNLTITDLTISGAIGTPQTGLTKVYRIYNELNGFYDKTIAITKIPVSTNILNNSLKIDDFYYGGNIYKTTKNPIVLTWDEYYLQKGNSIYLDYYFNGNYVGKLEENSVTLQDAGVYYFQFSDFAGNKQTFGTQNYYKVIVLNQVLFSMNNLDPVNDRIYNEPVSLKVEQMSEYDYRTLSISATRNGAAITPLKVNDAYIFSDFGLYTITLTARVTLPSEEPVTITTVYSFMILNKNEAKLSFEYSPQTGYEILSVLKDGVNVTNSFKTRYNSNTLTRLFISKEEGGNGNYLVTVKASHLTLKPSQVFTFNVWVNNETPIILSSIKQGSTTTKNIMLTFNKYLIFQQVGDSVIKINGQDAIIINAETSSVNTITNHELSLNTTYLVQLQTNMGNTVLSFKVVKKAPLNSVAVFLIVIGSLIVTALVIIFIRLRTKMRVS